MLQYHGHGFFLPLPYPHEERAFEHTALTLDNRSFMFCFCFTIFSRLLTVFVFFLRDEQAKVVEVEHRMLLSSLAWFTSLFCLVLVLGNCCLKTCRVLGGGERGGVGSGRRNGRRRDGLRERRGCDSCSPSRSAADMCTGDDGTPTSTPSKESLHWQVDGGGGCDGDVDRSSPPPGLSSWEVASTAERVRGAEERYSPGVSRF